MIKQSLNLILCSVVFLFLSCSEAKFSDQQTQKLGENAVPEIPTEPEEIPKCPAVDQDILVIDMKSGWWAGDGGNFFMTLLTGITSDCIGKISIEYHHILKKYSQGHMFTSDGENSKLSDGNTFSTIVKDPSLAKYTQVWILSGAFGDPADIRPESSVFQDLMSAVISSKANIFLGAGYGSRMHAQPMSNALGMSIQFETTQREDALLFAKSGNVTVLEHLQIPESSKSHALFQHGVDKIAETVKVGKATAHSDYFTGSSVKVLVKDADSRSIIGTTTKNDKRIVVDAGLQRYYSIYASGNKSTLRLLQNILVYLGEE